MSEHPVLAPWMRSSPLAVYVFDPTSLAIVDASHTAAAFYGYLLEDFLALTVDRLVATSAWEVAGGQSTMPATPIGTTSTLTPLAFRYRCGYTPST